MSIEAPAHSNDWSVRPTIMTVGGHYFHYADPLSEAGMDIESIAQALANTCRFCGHVKKFCSVAEHSVWVSRLCKDYPYAGLMHDASEAYLNDMPSPIKAHIPGYKEWEHFIMQRLAAFHDFTYPVPDEVKRADRRMLLTEARKNTSSGDDGTWRLWGFDAEPLGNLNIPQCWSPEEARKTFLNRYYTLRESGAS